MEPSRSEIAPATRGRQSDKPRSRTTRETLPRARWPSSFPDETGSGDPAVELRANFIQVRTVARQQIGLRQNHQVLMPVQFPNQLVVAGARAYRDRECGESKPGRFRCRARSRAASGCPARYRGSRQDWKPVALGSARPDRSICCATLAGSARQCRLRHGNRGCEGGVEGGW